MRGLTRAHVLVVALGLAAVACNESEDGAVRDAGNGGDAAVDGGEADASENEDASADAGKDAGDGMQEVSIRFKAKVGERDLACGEHYPDQGATHVTATPQDFRFYVQEVRLVRADGTEEKVEFDVEPPFQSKDVALLDFTDGEGSCGSGGTILNTTIKGKVAAGEYEGIVFVNGVPEALNHAGPAESAEPPLDDTTLFWNWLSGYRFIIAELLPVGAAGHVDGGADGGGAHDAGAGDGGHAADGGAAGADGGHDADGGAGGDAGHGGDGHGASAAAFVHIGSTGCGGISGAGFSCMRLARNEIRLDGFDVNTNYVVADLAEVFKTSDLHQPLQCHGIAAPCAAPYSALGIDMETGQPNESQQVFRVE
jgi:hypothetical protein